MSIQRKFAILIGLIGLSVVVTISAALWAVSTFQRELSDPFQATATVLDHLDDMKRSLTAGNAAMLQLSGAEASQSERLRRLADSLDNSLSLLLADDASRRRLGVGAIRTLEVRLDRAVEDLRSAASGAMSETEEARRLANEDAVLIQRIENRLLADAQRAVSHGEVIWRQMLVVMGFAFLLAVMTCALSLILVRRWILRPIRALRRAAVRIGAGDYEHRIAVHGHDEFARLSAEVNDMAGLIDEMQRERVEKERLAAAGEIIRRLAHNIRNPLAGIRSLAEVARAESPPDSDFRATQDRIIGTVDKFERWLKELLQSTTPLRIEPAPHEIQPWLASIADSHRALAESRSVRIELTTDDAPKRATFDDRHLEQALVAILSNAIEVSPEGAEVRIEAGRTGDLWMIRIRDHGPGIAPEFVEKVFAANFTTKPDGHGIGLAVAQQVVRGHQGRIFVEPPVGAESGSGASFVVELPIEPPTVEPSEDSGEHLNGVISGENSHH